MKKVKIGIIGCGGIANGKHMPALSRLDDVEMTAFCDIVAERAADAAARALRMKEEQAEAEAAALYEASLSSAKEAAVENNDADEAAVEVTQAAEAPENADGVSDGQGGGQTDE